MAEGEEGSTETVKFISADGHEFVVDRKCALVSGTIKSMLSGPGMLHIHPHSLKLTFLQYLNSIETLVPLLS
jgi:hypothetical protein